MLKILVMQWFLRCRILETLRMMAIHHLIVSLDMYSLVDRFSDLARAFLINFNLIRGIFVIFPKFY